MYKTCSRCRTVDTEKKRKKRMLTGAEQAKSALRIAELEKDLSELSISHKMAMNSIETLKSENEALMAANAELRAKLGDPENDMSGLEQQLSKLVPGKRARHWSSPKGEPMPKLKTEDQILSTEDSMKKSWNEVNVVYSGMYGQPREALFVTTQMHIDHMEPQNMEDESDEACPSKHTFGMFETRQPENVVFVTDIEDCHMMTQNCDVPSMLRRLDHSRSESQQPLPAASQQPAASAGL